MRPAVSTSANILAITKIVSLETFAAISSSRIFADMPCHGARGKGPVSPVTKAMVASHCPGWFVGYRMSCHAASMARARSKSSVHAA